MARFKVDPTNGNLIPLESSEMIANIEPLSKAAHAYSAGDQFVYGGILYTAMSDIAVGASISPGSNCVPSDPIVDQLKNKVGFEPGQDGALINGAVASQRWSLRCRNVNDLNADKGHLDALVVSDASLGLWDDAIQAFKWRLSYPVAVAQGGTNATSAAKAKENLGLGKEAQNFVVSTASGGTNMFSMTVNVANSDNTGYLNHRVSLVPNGAGIQLWDDTTQSSVWSFGLPLGTTKGGTGLTAAPSLRVNLGSTAAASVMQASPRPGVQGKLGIAYGGTNATNAADAKANLGLGTSAQNFQVMNPSGASEVLYHKFVCKNANNTSRSDHSMILVLHNTGVQLWDSTNKASVWNIALPLSLANGGTGSTGPTDVWNATNFTINTAVVDTSSSDNYYNCYKWGRLCLLQMQVKIKSTVTTSTASYQTLATANKDIVRPLVTTRGPAFRVSSQPNTTHPNHYGGISTNNTIYVNNTDQHAGSLLLLVLTYFSKA